MGIRAAGVAWRALPRPGMLRAIKGDWRRTSGLVAGALLSLALLLCAALPAGAAEFDRVVVQADEYGLWDGQERVFVAHGNVRVTHRGQFVQAETMRYNLDTEEVFFEGDVIYRDGDNNELRGNALVYHVGREEGWLADAEGLLYWPETGEPVFLFGERIHRNPERILINRGRLTTCDVGEPPYHFAAREMEIYPGDRIVIRGVTFVEHGIPLLYWPYMVLSLKERQSRFDFPRVGHTSEDGWYLKTTYNYYFDGGDYGSAYLDYYELRGTGYGARHVYQDTGTNRGEIYLYTVPNRYGGMDYEGEWKQEFRLDSGLYFDAFTRYEQIGSAEGTTEVWEADFDAGRIHSRGAYRLYVDYDSTETTTPIRDLYVYGHWRYRLNRQWNLLGEGSLREWVRGAGDEREISYLARAERTWGQYRLGIDLERRFRPEDDSDVPWRSMHRWPEVSLATSRRILGVPLTVEGSAGHFREFPGDVEAWRGMARVQVSGHNWRLSPRMNLISRGSVAGYIYDTEERQLSLDSTFTLNYRPFPAWRLSARFDWRDFWGSSPFRFDRVTPTRSVSPQADWARGPWFLQLTSRYDLLTEQWSPVVGQLRYRRGTRFDARLYGTYDIEQRTFGALVATVELSPHDRLWVRLGARYDVPSGAWTRWDMEAAIPLGRTWSLGTTAIYDVEQGAFTRGTVELTKNLSCRELKFSYDHIEGEYWIEYRIYAFPQSRIRVGRTQEELLFESDILKELME